MRITYKIDDTREFILLGHGLLQILDSYRQLFPKQNESGGVMIGRRLKQGNHSVVDKITEPNLCDQATRTTFRRSWWHNVVARREWIKSDKTQNILGLWHSHPEPYPTPSGTDLADWGKFASHEKNFGTEFYFAIIGTKAIHVWKGEKKSKTFIKLKQK